MKEQVTVEKIKCDFCGKEAWKHCLHCGKDICYECIGIDAKEYKHGIHVGGSGDGLYCNECDGSLKNSDNKIHAAYRKIEALRNEANGSYAEFEKRGKLAEKALEKLQEKDAK